MQYITSKQRVKDMSKMSTHVLETQTNDPDFTDTGLPEPSASSQMENDPEYDQWSKAYDEKTLEELDDLQGV